MDEVVRRLPEDFVTFFIDLRAHVVTNVEEFYDVLFSYEVGLKRKITKFSDVISSLVSSAVRVYSGFPLPENLIGKVLRKDKPKNAFTYIFNVLQELKSKGKTPVVILDELQVIRDLKIDGPLIYELFNFFVTLSKRHHLAHVFAITSDSLFIEKVHSEAMLHGRCDYLLVDDFDYEATKEFLQKYGFSREEIELAWEYLGGKPVYLVGAIKNRDRLREFCENVLKVRISQILDTIYGIEGKLFEEVLSYFREISEKEVMRYRKIDEALKFCVRNNILFLDPVERIVKPQSRIDLLAIRKILSEIS
jgi:AAA+ ATPase superfamily predicted ATPase